MFEFPSRYASVANAVFIDDEGRIIIYKRRRFLPQPDAMAIMAEVVFTAGDRLDLVAARVFGAPEQFWLLCDANTFLADPFRLDATAIGRRLRVPAPQFQVGQALALGGPR
jgi:hypothetical protein